LSNINVTYFTNKNKGRLGKDCYKKKKNIGNMLNINQSISLCNINSSSEDLNLMFSTTTTNNDPIIQPIDKHI
jgi:hypothetical protein